MIKWFCREGRGKDKGLGRCEKRRKDKGIDFSTHPFVECPVLGEKKTKGQGSKTKEKYFWFKMLLNYNYGIKMWIGYKKGYKLVIQKNHG